MTRRRPGALIEIRCPEKGHWLGSVYRARADLRILVNPRTVLNDNGQPLFARRHWTGGLRYMDFGGMPVRFRCCLRGGLVAMEDEIEDAAARAVTEGRTVPLIASLQQNGKSRELDQAGNEMPLPPWAGGPPRRPD